MRTLNLSLTEPQAEFLGLKCKYPCFIGGYGVGKSQVMVTNALLDGFEGGSSALIAMYEPTFDLVRLIIAPRMQEMLTNHGIRFRYNKSENIIYTSNNQIGDFVFRNLDNPSRIVGYESFRSHIDELDTLKAEHAKEVWEKVIARNRQKPHTYKKIQDKPLNTVSAYTTPDGYKFCYNMWKDNPKKGYEFITAPTSSNPFLPDDYIENLKNSYPPQLILAYLEGQFVNLTSGNVYRNFDRKLNSTTATIQDGEAVHIGQDFNITNMTSAVMVIRNGMPHFVDEITKSYDTEESINIIRDRYWKRRQDGGYIRSRPIFIYPDASASSRKSVSGKETDISMLRKAGFTVIHDSKNPSVTDRVNNVNAMICNGKQERRLFVNVAKCPTITNCLEKQTWGKNGFPDKTSGFDHGEESVGYVINHLFKINFTETRIRSASA